MSNTFWQKNNNILINSSNEFITCEKCPCIIDKPIWYIYGQCSGSEESITYSLFRLDNNTSEDPSQNLFLLDGPYTSKQADKNMTSGTATYNQYIKTLKQKCSGNTATIELIWK